MIASQQAVSHERLWGRVALGASYSFLWGKVLFTEVGVRGHREEGRVLPS